MATQKGVLQTFFILLYLFGICVSVQNGESSLAYILNYISYFIDEYFIIYMF